MRFLSCLAAAVLAAIPMTSEAATISRVVVSKDINARFGAPPVIGDITVRFTGEDGVAGGVAGNPVNAALDGILKIEELTFFEATYAGLGPVGPMNFTISDLGFLNYIIMEPLGPVHIPAYPLTFGVSKNPTNTPLPFQSVTVSTLARVENGAGNFLSTSGYEQIISAAVIPLPATGTLMLGILPLAYLATRRRRQKS